MNLLLFRGGMDAFFSGGGFEILFFLVFFLILAAFVTILIRSIAQWGRNQKSPRLTVEAKVVSRRTDTSTHFHNTGAGAAHTTHSTWYYVTFQVESGDRMEFSVSGREYGMIAEGDRGKLTFQGTRYLNFERS